MTHQQGKRSRVGRGNAPISQPRKSMPLPSWHRREPSGYQRYNRAISDMLDGREIPMRQLPAIFAPVVRDI